MIGFVIVSHSATAAAGVIEIAAQMAPDVPTANAGGTDSGELGTSFGRVFNAVSEIRANTDGVVIMADLGSAKMTAESVIEMFGDPEVALGEGPFLEGAVAGSVSAQIGDDLIHVLKSVRSSCRNAPADPADTTSDQPDSGYSRVVTVVDDGGLHARPAALLARLASEFDSDVYVNGVDAASLVSLMAASIGQGAEVTVTADGDDARAAIDAVADAIAAGLEK